MCIPSSLLHISLSWLLLKLDMCYLSRDETDGIIHDDVCEHKRGLTKYPLDVSHTSVYMSLSGLSCCLKGVPVGGGDTARLQVQVWWYHMNSQSGSWGWRHIVQCDFSYIKLHLTQTVSSSCSCAWSSLSPHMLYCILQLIELDFYSELT